MLTIAPRFIAAKNLKSARRGFLTPRCWLAVIARGPGSYDTQSPRPFTLRTPFRIYSWDVATGLLRTRIQTLLGTLDRLRRRSLQNRN